jgi:hypothetical protein
LDLTREDCVQEFTPLGMWKPELELSKDDQKFTIKCFRQIRLSHMEAVHQLFCEQTGKNVGGYNLPKVYLRFKTIK